MVDGRLWQMVALKGHTGRTREFSRLSIFAKNFVKSFLVSFRFQKKIL